MKSLFFKILYCFIIFSNFSILEKFLISSQKTSQLRWKSYFVEIIPFELHSSKKLPHIAPLRKFKDFLRKNPFFSKKTSTFVHFDKFHCFSRILLENCYNWVKKFTFRNVNEHRSTWKQLANNGYKKFHLRGSFFFQIL